VKRFALALALLLPLVGLAASIGVREAALAGSTEWRIPITGYDPRDPLRGHYINFVYAWEVTGDARLCERGACQLCLSERGGQVAARIAPLHEECAAPVRLRTSKIMRIMGSSAQFASRLFVSEASAPELSALLREEPMVVVARLTRSGKLINERIEPAASN
jgi:hypothetical protein